MGSVKDLVVLKKPSPGEAGTGNFVFSDRYSVFDWGSLFTSRSISTIGPYRRSTIERTSCGSG